MPLEDYLLPNESVLYQSNFDVTYADKKYVVLLTNLRLVLFARRGLIFKSDDVITEAIRDVQGIKYKERGILIKTAYVEIISTSKIVLTGRKEAMKTLYQRLLPFLSPELRMAQSYQPPPQPAYIPTAPLEPYSSPIYCSNCGNELSPNAKFCHNCGKPLTS